MPHYRIQLSNCHGLRWFVLRRYSDFERLHQDLTLWWRVMSITALRRAQKNGGRWNSKPLPWVPAWGSPPLPGTKVFGRTNSDPESVERRRCELEAYLRGLLLFRRHCAQTASLVEDFLEVPAVRLAQTLLAAPARLADPTPSPVPGDRASSFRASRDVECFLLEASAGCPAILLSPPHLPTGSPMAVVPLAL